jgi:hypothetical protein
MCLLTVFEPEAEVNVTHMTEAAYNNPDGFGFAIGMGEHIVRFRSMNFTETLDYFTDLRGYYPDTWAIFHHRFSTGGGETVENCHPFTWGHDERIAIAHNGVLPIRPGKRKSDTRIWAENHLANMGPEVLDSQDWWDKTEKWLGTSKAAVLTAHPNNQYSVYILNERLGHWDNGVWYSNRSYETFRPSRFTSMYGYTPLSASADAEPEDIELITCGVCDTSWDPGLQFTETECPGCGTCWICDVGAESCMCWEGPDTNTSSEPRFDQMIAELDEAGITPEQHIRTLFAQSIGNEGP